MKAGQVNVREFKEEVHKYEAKNGMLTTESMAVEKK